MDQPLLIPFNCTHHYYDFRVKKHQWIFWAINPHQCGAVEQSRWFEAAVSRSNRRHSFEILSEIPLHDNPDSL